MFDKDLMEPAPLVMPELPDFPVYIIQVYKRNGFNYDKQVYICLSKDATARRAREICSYIENDGTMYISGANIIADEIVEAPEIIVKHKFLKWKGGIIL